MSISKKSRTIVALSAGAAVGLSATAMVLLKEPDSSGERLKRIQSALRDAVATGAKASENAQWVHMAARKD